MTELLLDNSFSSKHLRLSQITNMFHSTNC